MCTTISFKHQEGYVFGRTLELGMVLDHDIMFVPKGHKDFIKAQDHTIDAKYAVLGSAFAGYEAFGDGINSHGLMGSYNYYPGFGSFSEETKDNALNMMMAEAFNYLLTQCKDISEVIAAAKNINIIAAYEGRPSPQAMSSHFFFQDAHGKGLVLEPSKGVLIAHDNPYGVLTNAPNFDWHVTNLKNYIHLNQYNIDETSFNNIPTTKLGEGSGMLGIPGDFTPTSRFIRAAYFVSSTPKDLNKEAAILQAFRILSQFDIPVGSIIDKQHGHQDETIYTGVMDTKDLLYVIKCQNNIDLQSFKHSDFNDATTIIRRTLKKEMIF